MGVEVVKESWFGNLWRTSRKNLASEADKSAIGILSFEVASLMSKVVTLWHCLSDKQIGKLRDDIKNSIGIQRLVSDDRDYLMGLALSEFVDNLKCLAKSVARLGKRCVDPIYFSLDHVFDDPLDSDLNWTGWEYRLKKMERRVKKMERFAAATSQLYEELEVLSELENCLRRMQMNATANEVKLQELHPKVMWQRQQVTLLRDISPWVRTYDYITRLLLRSLFTLVERIKYVFVMKPMVSTEGVNDPELDQNVTLFRSRSLSALARSSVHPSEKSLGVYGGPFGSSASNLAPKTQKNSLQVKKLPTSHLHPPLPFGKPLAPKSRRVSHVGPFIGCMTAKSVSPVLDSCMTGSRRSSFRVIGDFLADMDGLKPMDNEEREQTCRHDIVLADMFLLNSKPKLPRPKASTLGDAALALHYANLIILIQKLALSPNHISLDARNELYNMLTSSIKNSLKAKLILFSKTMRSSPDPALASDWSVAMEKTLEWLAPLAHNMVKWNSDRNFENQRTVCRSNVFLVQTMHFADQTKTEAAITCLLMGLHYISRLGSEIKGKTFLESACVGCDDYLLQKVKTAHR